MKKILKSPKVQAVLAWLASWYVRIVYYTGRWHVIGEEWPQQYLQNETPFIVCFWHSRLLMAPYGWSGRNRPFHMMISEHGDGQLIAKTVAHFGIDTIFGSTSQGSLAAVRAIYRHLKQGHCVGLTPDGPRGPRQRINSQVVAIAEKAGVDIIPLTYATRRRILFKSWDRFHLPLPFSRGVLIWGPAIAIARGRKSLEEWQAHLETVMNDQLHQAESAMGHTPLSLEEDHS